MSYDAEAMRAARIVVLTVLLGGCGGSAEGPDSLDKTGELNIHIGETRDAVRKRFGKPERLRSSATGKWPARDTFSDWGVSVSYDDDHRVNGYMGTYMSHGKFEGTIYGIALASRVDDWIARAGPAARHDPTPFEYDRWQWEYPPPGGEPVIVTLEVWKETGKDGSYGDYVAGTVKHIEVRAR